MRKRLGNFFIFCGLICLVLFFTSNAFVLDEGVYFFGGISLLSLGLLLRRGARRRGRRRRRRRGRERQDAEQIDD